LGATLARRCASAEKQFEAAQSAADNALETTTSAEKAVLVKQCLAAERALEQAKQTRADYHEHLQGMAEEIHPFSLSDNRPKSAKQVEKGLENRAQAFESIAAYSGPN
jgi:hypothetical protein